MTLILTTFWHRGVSQIAHRQLSREIGAKVTAFDLLSNKTILFAARDAFVTMSYSGYGYIEGTPTDEWIVGILRGRPMNRAADGVRPSSISLGRITPWPSIGIAVRTLAEEIEAAYKRLGRPARKRFYLGIALAGWQVSRRQRPRVFALTIRKHDGLPSPKVDRVRRHLGRGGGIFDEPEGYMEPPELDASVRGFIDGLKQDPKTAEQAIIDGLRTVAKRNRPKIGEDCMCVLIPPPHVGWARVRFAPMAAHRGTLKHAKGRTDLPIAFSPWIVTQGMTMAPSIMVGGQSVDIGPWKLEIEAPESDQGGILSIISSQSRPRL